MGVNKCLDMTWFKIRGPFLGHRWRFWRCLKMVVWALFHAIYIMRNSYFSLSMQNQAIGKFSKKFLYLAPYPHIDFTIEAGKKFMSKKKATRNWLTFIKKAFHREFHIVIGHLSMFSLFWFWPQTRRGFFFDIFLNFFRISDRKPIFPNTEGSTYQERSVFVSLWWGNVPLSIDT